MNMLNPKTVRSFPPLALGLGVMLALTSSLTIIWLRGVFGTKITHLPPLVQSRVAQVVDGENLIGDWVVADAVAGPKNVLAVTVSMSKELGVKTIVNGELVILLRGHRIHVYAIENEFVGANIGSKSFVLRFTTATSLGDIDPQELDVEWAPEKLVVRHR